MPRPNPLADPDFAGNVAQAFVDGNSREQMCEMFGVRDPHTITRWRRDPRVKALCMKLIEDRVLAVTRKVDASIQKRLLKPGDLTVTELLNIRKEFLGGALRAQTEKADEDTINEAQQWLENNPDMAANLDEMIRTGSVPGTNPPDDE